MNSQCAWARPTVAASILTALFSSWGYGCADVGTNSGAIRGGSLLFDLRAGGLVTERADPFAASVIDSLALDITSAAAGDVARHGRRIVSSDTVVLLEVSVPDGPNTFHGAVLSSNGTLLYDGSETEEIRRDGFTVDLRLRPVAPVLAIDPDSVALRSGSVDSSLIVLNRGSGVLAWRQETMDPANSSCEPAPCLFLRPAAGQLEAGESQRILIETNRIAPQLFTLAFTSPQGALEVRLSVTR